MSVIVDIDHETGNLSQYTYTSGSPTISAGAALAGTNYGMAVVANGATVYGRKDYTGNYNTSSYRYYIDPNGISMPEGSQFLQLNIYAASQIAGGYLKYTAAGGYQVFARLYSDDNAYHDTSFYSITDGPHYVEIRIQRASSNVASDAEMQLRIDGNLKETITGIDCYDRFTSNLLLYLGAAYYSGGSPSGTIYLDELVANDDGGEIGPVSSGAYTLSAAQQSYTLTGQAANVLFGRKYAAVKQDFTLTGEDANILYGRKFAAVQQTYSLTGIEVTLTKSGVKTLAAAYAAFALTGEGAGLLFGRKFAGAKQDYTLGGQAANLLYGRVVAADRQSYTINGQDVLWERTYNLSAVYQSYILTGIVVSMSKGPVSGGLHGTPLWKGIDLGVMKGMVKDA